MATATLALTGCAASGPAFQEAASAPAGKALVYIYRPSGFVLAARDAHFFIDGQPLVDLSNNGYTQTYLSEGRHQIMEQWSSFSLFEALPGVPVQKVELPLDVKSGEVYYFRFSTGGGQSVAPGITLAWRLERVMPQQGAAEITLTKYQPAK